ncbi:hypothetical protein [Kosakonia sp. MUSA4]|uniref:hypothetical protein n=1 Tax=Kosakonia sp. MUSA4 TaxID=2067958 RepID=UPI00159A0D96|nr:hypothetical protein [Kosakonia sp. MUSA4]QJT79589.1 hypothetical protein C0557_05655 [Kosakonia sp. MUSA4]
MAISPIQKQIASLEAKVEVLESIINIAKTPGGRISDDGKNLIYILRNAKMNKTDIAKLLDISPAALSKYD